MTPVQSTEDIGYFSEEAATFGDRAAGARRAMGLTQERLSQKMGIKLKTLQAWENDMSEPRANKLQMLAGVLNISIIWLLTGEGEGVADPWADTKPISSETTDLISEFRAVRQEYRRLETRLNKIEKMILAAAKS